MFDPNYFSKPLEDLEDELRAMKRRIDARTKAKIPVREIVPQGFAISMKEVAVLIAAGDNQTTTESDDLIQIRGKSVRPFVVTGGLYSAKENRFGFAYYEGDYDAGEGVDEGGTIEWCYDLSPSEVEGIANGVIVEREMWRCEPDCGRRWDRPDGYCGRCDRV